MSNVRDVLKFGFVKVVFNKKDGTERVFERATQKMDLIPEELHPKGTGTLTDGVIRVFVEELDQWRSFREDSLVKYTVVE